MMGDVVPLRPELSADELMRRALNNLSRLMELAGPELFEYLASRTETELEDIAEWISRHG